MELYIWWLTREECERVRKSCLTESLPRYLKIQFRARSEQVGRTHIWVAPEFGTVVCGWDGNSAVCQKIEEISAGGIVVKAEDAELLDGYGFVTDLNCQPVVLSPEES